MIKVMVWMIVFFYFLSSTAAQEVFNPINYKEEVECFTLLEKKIWESNEFKDVQSLWKQWNVSSLNGVMDDETQGGVTADYSTYEKFWKNRAVNPQYLEEKITRDTKGFDAYDFLLRRTHIGTITTNWNYVVSNIVGFGRDSSFDFPYSTPGTSLWDTYVLRGENENVSGYFREFLLYTHHSIRWDFLSCGLVRITPADWKTYGEIDESRYAENVLEPNAKNWCNSSFAGAYMNDRGTAKNLDYYAMNVQVCAADYNGDDLLKMDVISIAYDNGSNYANEYISHPYQVAAMSDPDARTRTLAETQSAFLNSLKENTCLKIVHGSNLPERCKTTGFFQNIRSNFLSGFSFIPQVEAKREFQIPQEDIDAAAWAVVYEALALDLYNTLKTIPDTSLQESLILALHPNFEARIEHKKENNIELSPYEKIFSLCGMSYEERVRNVEDFIQKYDADTFSYTTIEYLNPKFWDCVIPYPDKKNILQVVPYSFPSNQFLAQKMTGQYVSGDISSEMQVYAQKMNALQLAQQQELEVLFSRFEADEITQEEYIAQEKQIRETYTQKIGLLDQEQNAIAKEVNTKINTFLAPNEETPSRDIFKILAGVGVLLLGLILVIYGTMRLKKIS